MRPAALPGLLLAALLALPAPALAMATAGLDEMLEGEAPRDGFRLYRWEENHDVVVIHFDTYLVQSHALSRMAMFQEMSEGRGRIMSQQELTDWFAEQGTNLEGLFGAHDYRTADLARFYNALWQSGEQPWPAELAVADALVAEGLLRLESPADGAATPRSASPYSAAGNQAVLSFATRLASPGGAGKLQGQPGREWEEGALYHESRHGIFFTDPLYARRCTEFWQQQLSEAERRCLRIILGSLNYDPGFEELMVNEFQAYMLSPAGPGSGPNILRGRGKLLLSERYETDDVGPADRDYFHEHGQALLTRMGSLPDELRDWLAE